MDNPYEITPHTAGRRQLSSSDRSRYHQVRLTVTRGRRDDGIVSIIARSVGDGLLQDSRVFAGSISMAPGSPESQDVVAALEAALQVVRELRDLGRPAATTSGAKRPGIPRGGSQGATVTP
jgi:hypothetical protein